MRAYFRGFLAVLALMVILAAVPAMQTAAVAQTAVEGGAGASEAGKPPPATADLQRIVETLEDDTRRKAFVEDLKALIEAREQAAGEKEPPVGTRILEGLSQNVDRVGKELGALAAFVLDLPAALSWLQRQIASAEARTAGLIMIAKLSAILAAGLILQVVARFLLQRPYRAVESQSVDNIVMRAFFVTLRTLLELIPVAVFVAVAYGMLTLLNPVRDARVVALALINAVAVSSVLLSLAKMVFAPHVTAMRLIPMQDESANYGFLWCRRLICVSVYGFFGVEALSALGAPRAVHNLLVPGLGLIICLLLIMLILQNRQGVADRIRGDAGPLIGQFRRRLADVWHLLAIIYLVTIYGVWTFDLPGGFEFIVRATILSVVIVVVIQGLVIVLSRLIRRGFSLSDEQRQRFPGLEARANRYLPVLLSVMQAVLYVVGALAFLQTWGLHVVEWFSTPLGAAIVSRFVTIGLIVAIALVFWEVVSAVIERYLSARDDSGNVIQRGQRVQTLLPLLRNVVLIFIAVMVILTVLSELGVDTGPLIAGAGILGLAIGFGAQTFVKDVITGFFILVEDSVAVGDLVELGGHRGKVEAMSIRSIQLRDLQGHVHRVPFSEVTTTVNRSKVFSYAFFDIGVAYRENVDHCMEVIRALGDEFREDSVFGPDILEPIDIMGVQSFADSAVVIRARIKVRPGRQLPAQRAFNRLLKNRFDAEGIEIPFPHRTVYFGVDSHGDAPPAHLHITRDAARGNAGDRHTSGVGSTEGEDVEADGEKIPQAGAGLKPGT